MNNIVQWILRYFSREFVLTVGVLGMIYALAMAEKLSTEAVAAIGPVMMYVWGRTKQKTNGNKK